MRSCGRGRRGRIPRSCVGVFRASSLIDEDAIGKKKQKRKESKLKYSCPLCDANVWGKPGLHVRCDDCDVSLVSDEANDAEDAGTELRAA